MFCFAVLMKGAWVVLTVISVGGGEGVEVDGWEEPGGLE
jgi:hypothetical protein